ncbi:MAG TPA: transporter substrate-binding domain-containing protein [Geminicoccaceae bacterium]|nr:transporter substrate-binding domain-containing protein [Geminicoccaceae bacterium]
MIIPVPRDQLLPALLEGRGDIAAANLTITPERQVLVDFADPLLTGRELAARDRACSLRRLVGVAIACFRRRGNLAAAPLGSLCLAGRPQTAMIRRIGGSVNAPSRARECRKDQREAHDA